MAPPLSVPLCLVLFLVPLSQPYSGAAAVLVNEFDLELDAFERSLHQIGRLRLALPLSLFQPKPWGSAILVDELDP